VRTDYFGFDVSDQRESTETRDDATSGIAHDAIVSPKATAVLTPVEALDVYLNFGTGFHSNDARGVVRQVDPVDPLTRAIGGEIGSRLRLWDRLDLAGAFFVLRLDSENVWVGDEGTTEARGATMRAGGEVEVRVKVLPWLFADADATLTHAEFIESGDHVPLAPRLTVAGGVSARHPIGLYGRIGAVHVGDRPATEDGFLEADGFTRLDATVGYKHRIFELSLAAQNLTNTEWAEAQFANVSRLRDETDPADCPTGTRAVGEGADFEGCEDVHFTPGPPFSLQATATLFF